MIDLFKALGAQQRCGLFAANTAGAEHRHTRLFAIHAGELAAFKHFTRHPAGQLGEGVGVGVDRTFKSAYLYLIIIACVHQHHVGAGYQRVPVRRLDVLARHQRRVNLGYTHGDDLFFQAYLHAVERLHVCPRFLVLQPRQALVTAQPGQYGTHASFWPGNRAIDAFRCQQQRALDALRFAQGQQWWLKRRKVRQFNKLVKRSG